MIWRRNMSLPEAHTLAFPGRVSFNFNSVVNYRCQLCIPDVRTAPPHHHHHWCKQGQQILSKQLSLRPIYTILYRPSIYLPKPTCWFQSNPVTFPQFHFSSSITLLYFTWLCTPELLLIMYIYTRCLTIETEDRLLVACFQIYTAVGYINPEWTVRLMYFQPVVLVLYKSITHVVCICVYNAGMGINLHI